MHGIPTQIIIGNRTVTIEILDINELGLKGYYDDYEFRIVLNSSNDSSSMVETFWHELVHAMFAYINFRTEMMMEMDDKDTLEADAWKIEERTTDNFARIFMQVIQDNNLTTVNGL